jgi:hypothetical protein
MGLKLNTLKRERGFYRDKFWNPLIYVLKRRSFCKVKMLRYVFPLDMAFPLC